MQYNVRNSAGKLDLQLWLLFYVNTQENEWKVKHDESTVSDPDELHNGRGWSSMRIRYKHVPVRIK